MKPFSFHKRSEMRRLPVGDNERRRTVQINGFVFIISAEFSRFEREGQMGAAVRNGKAVSVLMSAYKVRHTALRRLFKQSFLRGTV